MKKSYRTLFRSLTEYDYSRYLLGTYLRADINRFNACRRIDGLNYAWNEIFDIVPKIINIAKDNGMTLYHRRMYGKIFRDCTTFRMKSRLRLTYEFNEDEVNGSFIKRMPYFLITDLCAVAMINGDVFEKYGERTGKYVFTATVPMGEAIFLTPTCSHEIKKIIEPDLLYFKLKHASLQDVL